MQCFKQVAKLSQNKEMLLQLLTKMRHTLKSAAEKSEKFVPVRNKNFNANHRHGLCLKHASILILVLFLWKAHTYNC